MTFQTQEASRSLGAPIRLFFFKYGDAATAYYAYTNAEQAVNYSFDPTVGLVTFQPTPITHSAIVSSGTLDKAALTVSTPQDSPLAQNFRVYPSSQVVILTIFEGHVGLNEFKVVWSGRVLGAGDNKNETEYTCEPASTSMKRPGLRRNWQRGCPLPLYGQGPGQCNADLPSASTAFPVTVIANALVSLGGGWATQSPEARNRYLGGLAIWTAADGRTERRTILKLYNDTVGVLLSGAASGLSAGMSVTLAWGCPHDLDGCAMHNNRPNYGGQWLIPTKNPFGIVNNFYN
jgi:hypothetical protein